MLVKLNNYAQLDDYELIKCVMATPRIQEAHNYFFNVKCTPILNYISAALFNNEGGSSILGEFYEFVSADNWKVLRMFSKRNGASLSSYLSRCTINYFLAKKKKEEKYKMESIDQLDIVKELDQFTQEEERKMPPVWLAYDQLNKRDQTVLMLLVIEEKSALEVAEIIWQYVNSKNKDWKALPAKRVQDTIAMLKRRALLSLSIELQAYDETSY